MPKFERRLRLVTGLVIAAYVTGHFLNHALGVVSVEAMDTQRFAGIAPPDVGTLQVEVRGRAGRLEVLPIKDPGTLLVPADQ